MQSQFKEDSKEFWNFITSKKTESGVFDRYSGINNISYSIPASTVQAFQDFFQSTYGAKQRCIKLLVT